jgi:hypothetical protein
VSCTLVPWLRYEFQSKAARRSEPPLDEEFEEIIRQIVAEGNASPR